MGSKDFETSVFNATNEIIKRLYDNMQRAGLVVEADAKKNVHVDQGQLRASMFTQTQMDSKSITTRVGNSSEYAPYYHQGTGLYALNGDGRKTPWCYYVASGKYQGFHITRGQAPKQFLENAKISNKERIERIIRGEE